MKRIALILCIVAAVLWPWTVQAAGIYNNSGTAAADSISIPFYLADSLGSPTAVAAADSVEVTVFYPSGALAFTEKVLGTAGQITTSGIANSYKNTVAAIDGTAREGVYSYIISAKDASLGLRTSLHGTFQLYAARDFDAAMDFVDQSIAGNVADADITLTGGAVTVGTNNDKTGYTASTVSDKTGYSISGTTTTFDGLQTALNSAHGAGSWATATGFSTHSAVDVWNTAFNTAFTGGSMGDSLNNPSYVQGSASGLTAHDIWAFQIDTMTTAGTPGKYLDTTITSIAAGSSNWSNAQRDSVLDAIRDGASGKNNFKATGFSTHNPAAVYTEFISGTNEDAFKATGFSTHSAVDVWAAATRTLTSGGSPWTTGNRDSALTALSDAAKANYKATGFSTHSAADVNTSITSAHGSGAYTTATGFSTFDPATTPVVADDTTAAGFTIARQDSLAAALEASRYAALAAMIVPTAWDSVKFVYDPANGAANKDGYVMRAFRGAAIDSLAYGYYHHTNVSTVADTVTVRKVSR